MARMPMFPLGMMVLPGTLLPLRVFEPRYRALVRDCMAAPTPEFGVVLIKRGREVGGGDVRNDVGVAARMLQVTESPDGRFHVLAVAGRRIAVHEWLPDDPYPCADVDDWPDDESTSADPALFAALQQRSRRARALAIELGDRLPDPPDELSSDLALATYQLAALAPIGDADRHELLRAEGPADRLVLLGQMLEHLEDVLSFRLLSGEA